MKGRRRQKFEFGERKDCSLNDGEFRHTRVRQKTSTVNRIICTRILFNNILLSLFQSSFQKGLRGRPCYPTVGCALYKVNGR